MTGEVRREPPLSPSIPVMLPGDPEEKERKIREREGIPVESVVLSELVTWATKLGVPVPPSVSPPSSSASTSCYVSSVDPPTRLKSSL